MVDPFRCVVLSCSQIFNTTRPLLSLQTSVWTTGVIHLAFLRFFTLRDGDVGVIGLLRVRGFFVASTMFFLQFGMIYDGGDVGVERER